MKKEPAARKIKDLKIKEEEVISKEELATFECTRNSVWFDLKLWMKGDELVCKESDVMKINTRHFERVDGKKDPRIFDKRGRMIPPGIATDMEKEEKEKKEEKPRMVTKAMIMSQLDVLGIGYDSSMKITELQALLPEGE